MTGSVEEAVPTDPLPPAKVAGQEPDREIRKNSIERELSPEPEGSEFYEETDAEEDAEDDEDAVDGTAAEQGGGSDRGGTSSLDVLQAAAQASDEMEKASKKAGSRGIKTPSSSPRHAAEHGPGKSSGRPLKPTQKYGSTPSPLPKKKTKKAISGAPRPSAPEAPPHPRLSPEPEGDPELARKVREKNRLRMYRYNRNLKKRALLESGGELPPAAPAGEPSVAAPPRKPSHRPSSTGDSEDLHAFHPPQQKKLAGKSQHHPAAVAAPPPTAHPRDNGSPTATASPVRTRDPPRLSPVPLDASFEEQKRIKAKNRLRLYRYNNTSAGGKSKSSKKRSMSTTSDVDLDEDDISEECVPSGSRHAEQMYHPAAYAGLDSTSMAAMIAAAAAQGQSSMPAFSAMDMTTHHAYSGMARPAGFITPRTSESGQVDMATGSPKSRKSIKTPPTAPPRLSPEPNDPVEAKRVRSKNRVRMHRYNQSLHTAQPLFRPGTIKPDAMAAPSMPQLPSQIASGAGPLGAMGYGLPPMIPGALNMGDMYRQVLQGLPPVTNSINTQSLFSEALGVDPHKASRPPLGAHKRHSDTGRDLSQHHHTNMQQNKMRRVSDNVSDSCAHPHPRPDLAFLDLPANVRDLAQVPFRDLPPPVRELALETYIKETMGMASSLQSLESELLRHQAASSNGPMAQQSTALHAAVSQLRTDAWRLSQLRLSQYAQMVGTPPPAQAPQVPRPRHSHPGDELKGDA